MKTFYFITVLLALGGGLAQAQTNASAMPRAAHTNETHIDSKRLFFSNITRQTIYTGSVHVKDPQMNLTCELLTIDFPKSGGHIERLVAETNVVMDSVDEKGQTNHATSDKAVYEYVVENGTTNEVITLTGHARAENSQIILYGEPIIYYRDTGSLTATNQHMIIKQNLTGTLMNTNAAAAKTNSLPVTAPQNLHQITSAPAVKTNLPPAVIQATNLPVIKTNLPPVRPQSISPKAPRNM